MRSTRETLVSIRLRPLALLTLFLPCLALSSTSALAKDKEEPADLSGTYAMSGKLVHGEDYTGTVEIKKRKVVQMRGNGEQPQFTFCDLKFHYSTGWEGIGVGALVDNHFIFALAGDGKMFTVALCRDLTLPDDLKALKRELKAKQFNQKKNERWFIKGDPWFQDVWSYPKYSIFFRADGDWGTEGIRLPLVNGRETDEEKPLGPGEWWWDQNHYSDKGKDESSVADNNGQMIVEEPNESGGLKITRRVDENFRKLGEPWDCVGMMLAPGVLLVGMGGNNSSGVGYYEIEGKTLKGKICDVDTVIPYEQTLAVPDAVASRNAELFH
jgi:hypothetical protein